MPPDFADDEAGGHVHSHLIHGSTHSTHGDHSSGIQNYIHGGNDSHILDGIDNNINQNVNRRPEKANVPPQSLDDLAQVPANGQPLSIFHRPWVYDTDPVHGPIWTLLREGKHQDGYWIEHGRLLYKGKPCVPLPMVPAVIMEYHREKHSSFMKTFLLLKRGFSFAMADRKLANMCEMHIKTCHICQAVKKKTAKRQGTMDVVQIPEDIFSCLCVNFV
jgi:hypothetical protein